MPETQIVLTEILSGPTREPARQVTAPMDHDTLQMVLSRLQNNVVELEATSLTLTYATTVGHDPADMHLRMYADGMFGLMIEQQGATFASEAMQLTLDDDEAITPAKPTSEYPH